MLCLTVVGGSVGRKPPEREQRAPEGSVNLPGSFRGLEAAAMVGDERDDGGRGQERRYHVHV